MPPIKLSLDIERRDIEVNKGDPVLLYTKGKHTTVIFGFFESVRQSRSMVRGGNWINAQYVTLAEAYYLRELLTVRGSKIPHVLIPSPSYRRISLRDRHIEDIIIGQENIVQNLTGRGEDWKPYADWISRMKMD